MNVWKIHKTSLVLILLFVFPVRGNQLHQTVIDTLPVTYKPVPVVIIEHYKQLSDFQYIEKQPLTNGLKKSFLYKIGQVLKRFFSGTLSTPVLRIITILIVFSAIIILVILLLTLFETDIQSLFIRNKGFASLDDLHDENKSMNVDFDRLAQREIDAENYQLAIRYLYLKLLKLLANKHLIAWQRDKTNRDYMNELTDSSYINDFKIITLDYEYIWYGKFQCNRFSFDSIHEQFKHFYRLLNA